MTRKTGRRLTKNRKPTAPRDLRPATTETVQGGTSYPSPRFLGGVRVASADVNNDGTATLKLAK
jgi:hypothetical protein